MASMMPTCVPEVQWVWLAARPTKSESAMVSVCIRTSCFSELAPTKPQTTPFLKSASLTLRMVGVSTLT